MSYTPPFRTRRATQPQVEPHLGDAESNPPEKTLTWTTASDRPLPDDPTPAHRPGQEADDDDALPVLTQLVEPPPARAFEPAPETVPEPVDEHIEEPIDEELVARITDDVLDALQPVLYELVGDAIRRALKENAR